MLGSRSLELVHLTLLMNSEHHCALCFGEFSCFQRPHVSGLKNIIKTNKSCAGEGVEVSEPACTGDGNTRWCQVTENGMALPHKILEDFAFQMQHLSNFSLHLDWDPN